MLIRRPVRRTMTATVTATGVACGLLLAVSPPAGAAGGAATVSDPTPPQTVSLTRRHTTQVTVGFRLQTDSGLKAPVEVTVVDRGRADHFAPVKATPLTGTDTDGTWQAELTLAAVMHGTHHPLVELCPKGRDCTKDGPLRLQLGTDVTVHGSDWPTLVHVLQSPRRLPAGKLSGAEAVGRVVFSKTREPVKGVQVVVQRSASGGGSVVSRTNSKGKFSARWPWPRRGRSGPVLALTLGNTPGATFDRMVLGPPATRFGLSHPHADAVTSVGRRIVVTGTVTPGYPARRLGPVFLEELRGSHWVRVDKAKLRPLLGPADGLTQRATYRLHTRFQRVGGHVLRVRKPAARCGAGECRIAEGRSSRIGVVAGNRVYFVERQLAKVGIPVGTVDGKVDVRDEQAFCVWRDITGLRSSRSHLTPSLVDSIMSRNRLPRAHRPDGIYVNKTCQMLLQVVNGKYRRIVWASTGMPGYETPNGTGAIFRKIEGPVESTLYPGAYMYHPMFFFPSRPGIALHGSVTNDLVEPYPASHGCVRVWRPQIHQIFNESPLGTRVKVYGSY